MLSAVLSRARLAAGALCIALLCTACARYQVDQQHYLSLPVERSRELAETPFFPQDDYQCGPAALATVLGYQGVEVSPGQLRPLVYLPQNKGSLQAEMLAAPGHFGHLAVPLHGAMDALLLELSAGRPVVVLQNFGLAALPVWHYAVAIGYDLEKAQIHLRSGTERRRTYGFRVFLKTWSRADYWAMTVVAPGRVPASATRRDYLQAAATLERLQNFPAALEAFAAATRRWPDSYLAWAGTGNAAYRLARVTDAESAYRRALQLKPEATSIMNNLAFALAEQGCKRTALTVLQCAIDRLPDSPTLMASRKEIRAYPEGSEHCRQFVCESGAQAAPN